MKTKMIKVILVCTLAAAILLIILISPHNSPKPVTKNTDLVLELIEKLSDSNLREVCRAIFALRKQQDYRALAPLAKALGHPAETVRNAATQALLDLQDLDAVTELLNVLNSRNAKLRKNAALVLGETGDYRAIAGLTRLLEDKHKDVKSAARKALDMLRPLSPDDHRRLLAIPPDVALAVAHQSSLAVYRFQSQQNTENKRKFTTVATIALESPRYLIKDSAKKQIIAVSPRALTVLDYNLNILHKKELTKTGAAAIYRDYLLVSDNGYLKAFHLWRNLEEIAHIPLIPSEYAPYNQRKNAHDIIVYQDTAFLLDNILLPVFVLKVNLDRLERCWLKTIETIAIWATPACSTPHLDGQWLNLEKNSWTLVISTSSFSGMGGIGGPSQGLSFLPIATQQLKHHFKSEIETHMDGYRFRESPYRYDYLLYSSKDKVLRLEYPFGNDPPRKPRPIENGNGFWIWAMTSMAPPWALIEKDKEFFVVRIAAEKEKRPPGEYEKQHYRVYCSRYSYVCPLEELPLEPGNFHIREQGRLIFVTLEGLLVVIDTQHSIEPFYRQDFPQPVQDFVIL